MALPFHDAHGALDYVKQGPPPANYRNGTSLHAQNLHVYKVASWPRVQRGMTEAQEHIPRASVYAAPNDPAHYQQMASANYKTLTNAARGKDVPILNERQLIRGFYNDGLL